ncbi:MAG: hypothetical protein R3F46_04370 [bacterium]
MEWLEAWRKPGVGRQTQVWQREVRHLMSHNTLAAPLRFTDIDSRFTKIVRIAAFPFMASLGSAAILIIAASLHA